MLKRVIKSKARRWVAFVALDFFPKDYLSRRRAIIESACEKFGFHAIFGERSGLDKTGGSAPEFLERLREAISAADLVILDITGFSRKSKKAPRVAGLNLNVILELGITYGSQKEGIEVLCNSKCRNSVRSRLSNLSGRSPTFLYYEDLKSFEEQILALLERRARSLHTAKPFSDIALLPHSTFSHPYGFTIEYPYGWQFIDEADHTHFSLIPGTSGTIISGSLFRNTIIEDTHDIGEAPNKFKEIEASKLHRFISHAYHTPYAGMATIKYRKLAIIPGREHQTDYKRLISVWRKRKFASAGVSVSHCFENIENHSNLILEITSDKDLAERSEALLSLVSKRVSGFLPGEDRTEELLRIKNFAVSVKYKLLEEHSDPGEYTGVGIQINNREVLSIKDFVGIKIPSKFTSGNESQSYCILMRECGDDSWILLLFGYQFASSPGELAVIYISREETKLCMRRPFEIAEIQTEKAPSQFRLIGNHAYSESLGENASTYDPPSIYGLLRGNLTLLENETIQLIRKTFGDFKGFDSSKDWKVIHSRKKAYVRRLGL